MKIFLARCVAFFVLFATMSIFGAESSVQYKYDAQNRLTNVSYGYGISVSYTYDQAGNRLTAKTVNPFVLKTFATNIVTERRKGKDVFPVPVPVIVFHPTLPPEKLTLRLSAPAGAIVNSNHLIVSGTGTNRFFSIGGAGISSGSTTIRLLLSVDGQVVLTNSVRFTVSDLP